jgi:biopolymer transport protein ExbD
MDPTEDTFDSQSGSSHAPDLATAAPPILIDDEPEEVAMRERPSMDDEMDITPMIDMTFLLLIFFILTSKMTGEKSYEVPSAKNGSSIATKNCVMMTASFSSEKVFEKPPPLSESPSSKPPDKPPDQSDTVRVQIDEFNAYTVIFSTGDEREASSKQDLLLALSEARAEAAGGKEDEVLKLLVDAHEECIHASIVAALDAGREAGFGSLSVTVVEEFE